MHQAVFQMAQLAHITYFAESNYPEFIQLLLLIVQRQIFNGFTMKPRRIAAKLSAGWNTGMQSEILRYLIDIPVFQLLLAVLIGCCAHHQQATFGYCRMDFPTIA
ncbi:MAG: hypothetical protein ONB16_05060 [candidate division KSB1 bacterium]|nr:hypothetical protein [candidate division KSB1 bacterium]